MLTIQVVIETSFTCDPKNFSGQIASEMPFVKVVFFGSLITQNHHGMIVVHTGDEEFEYVLSKIKKIASLNLDYVVIRTSRL